MKPICIVVTLVGLVLGGCGSPSGTDGGAGGGAAGGGWSFTGGGGGGGGDGGTAVGRFSMKTLVPSLRIGQGGVGTYLLDVIREGDPGTINFTFRQAPPGVSAAYSPAKVTGDYTQVAITVATTVELGSATLTIVGVGQSGESTLLVPFTVVAPVSVLLVDDDESTNNAGGTPVGSASDLLYASLLARIPHDVYVVPVGLKGATLAQMKNYQTVIWYCGAHSGNTLNVDAISLADEGSLKGFLDLGSRKVILFADEYLAGTDSTWDYTTNSFLTGYLHLQGGVIGGLGDKTFTATGVGPMAGLALEVMWGVKILGKTSALHVGAAQPLFAVTPDLIDIPTADPVDRPIAIGAKNVGDAGSSTAVLFAFPLENVSDAIPDAGLGDAGVEVATDAGTENDGGLDAGSDAGVPPAAQGPRTMAFNRALAY